MKQPRRLRLLVLFGLGAVSAVWSGCQSNITPLHTGYRQLPVTTSWEESGESKATRGIPRLFAQDVDEQTLKQLSLTFQSIDEKTGEAHFRFVNRSSSTIVFNTVPDTLNEKAGKTVYRLHFVDYYKKTAGGWSKSGVSHCGVAFNLYIPPGADVTLLVRLWPLGEPTGRSIYRVGYGDIYSTSFQY